MADTTAIALARIDGLLKPFESAAGMPPRSGREQLLLDAQRALRAPTPAAFAWFPFAELPPCRWLDGAAVAAEIVHWWISLSYHLKEPAGHAVLDRCLALLSPISATTLGSFLLTRFLKFDTKGPSERSALAYAEAQLAKALGRQHAMFQYGQQPFTAAEQAAMFDKFKREKLRDCAGSAISAKGVLALAHHAPGHEIASRTRAFMRDHHFRLAQIEALMALLGHNGDAASLQLLLAIAHTHRKAPIQRRAGELVAAIALRKGWTARQLADRSVPTAGFDERGVIDLAYGARALQIRLDDKLAPVLHGEDGTPIKTLPAPRKDDDAESVKVAKLKLSTCKKELKQVVARQFPRLREAMCTRRAWPQSEWRSEILSHPILGRLSQQLVWEAVDAFGAVRATFRPATDKSLGDAEDNAVALAEHETVRLAHGTQMAAAIAAWQSHFADYKLLPLFPQLTNPLPPTPANADPHAIADHEGWMADVYRLSGAFEKRGYIRGSAGESGYIRAYRKPFPDLDLDVEIGFTGVFVRGGNEAAALTKLCFKHAGENGRHLKIDAVPPVLLAEAYADYVAVAHACNGYDDEWQRLCW